MSRFRKKPIIIEAFQVTESLLKTPGQEPSWFVEATKKGDVFASYIGDIKNTQIQIKTLEGVMTAQVNDWIIRGIQGEIYPCKHDIFKKTYEPVID